MGLIRIFDYQKDLLDQEQDQGQGEEQGRERGGEQSEEQGRERGGEQEGEQRREQGEEQGGGRVMWCLNLKYDAPLIDIIPEFRRQTQIFTCEIRLLNRFGQEIPKGYRIRTDLDVYFSLSEALKLEWELELELKRYLAQRESPANCKSSS